MQKNVVKISNNIICFYCHNKKILIIKGPLNQKSLKLEVKILICKTKIKVTNIPFVEISKNKIKTLKAIQKTTVALIKQLILETKYTLYQKLNLIGVGYRVLNLNNFDSQLLSFRLGYSHNIYYKIPNKLKFFCLKNTKIFVFGNSLQEITKTTSQIRMNKLPDPYKGKGILYSNEKIILKKGKKI